MDTRDVKYRHVRVTRDVCARLAASRYIRIKGKGPTTTAAAHTQREKVQWAGRTRFDGHTFCGGAVALRDLAEWTDAGQTAAFCCSRGESRCRYTMSSTVGGSQFDALLSKGRSGVTWTADWMDIKMLGERENRTCWTQVRAKSDSS